MERIALPTFTGPEDKDDPGPRPDVDSARARFAFRSRCIAIQERKQRRYEMFAAAAGLRRSSASPCFCLVLRGRHNHGTYYKPCIVSAPESLRIWDHARAWIDQTWAHPRRYIITTEPYGITPHDYSGICEWASGVGLDVACYGPEHSPHYPMNTTLIVWRRSEQVR